MREGRCERRVRLSCLIRGNDRIPSTMGQSEGFVAMPSDLAQLGLQSGCSSSGTPMHTGSPFAGAYFGREL